MRLVRRISIASLVVSVATLALVLVMFVGERWESAEDTPTVEHTPRLTEAMAKRAIELHINDDLIPDDIPDYRPEEGWPENIEDIAEALEGYKCIWYVPYIYAPKSEHFIWFSPTLYDKAFSISYEATTDLWLITSVRSGCNDGQNPRSETWTVNDNTGAVAYEVPINELLEERG